jgi:HEPN domain-containing protein
MARQFTAADGLVTADMIHCGLDHLTAAQLLFESDAAHFDAAGYLSHMGVELLLKGWLLEVAGGFGATHDLGLLYATLREADHVGDLPEASASTLGLLNEFGELRYPNRNKPVEIGQDHWEAIALLASDLCNAMPDAITEALAKIDPTKKAGRVLMKRRIGEQD